MEGLKIRPARPGDTSRIAEITAGDPGPEETALLGGREQAREFGMAVVRLPKSPQGWERTVMAELDGRAVGMIQAGDMPDFRMTAWVVYLAVRIFGPVGVLRLVPRLRALSRVHPKRPEGSYHVAQMDVDPAYRNRGIGGAMLEHAEAEARKGGFKQMSLTTSTYNPARRLYERHGFHVVETKTDPAFEKYTGFEGRHLMIKDLN